MELTLEFEVANIDAALVLTNTLRAAASAQGANLTAFRTYQSSTLGGVVGVRTPTGNVQNVKAQTATSAGNVGVDAATGSSGL